MLSHLCRVVVEVKGTGEPKPMVWYGPGVPCAGSKHIYKQNKQESCLHFSSAVSLAALDDAKPLDAGQWNSREPRDRFSRARKQHGAVALLCSQGGSHR